MNVIHYEHAFDINEWFVLLSILILSIISWNLPKILSNMDAMVHILFGLFFGMAFDQNIGVPPFNFYDVNDSSSYQLMDFLSYIMYMPYSYIFIYLYVKLDIKGFQHIFYILCWTLVAILLEMIGTAIGLYHYRNGYTLYYSIPIYLFVQFIQIMIYRVHASQQGVQQPTKKSSRANQN